MKKELQASGLPPVRIKRNPGWPIIPYLSLLKVSISMKIDTVNSPTGKNGHFDSYGLFMEEEEEEDEERQLLMEGLVPEEHKVYNVDFMGIL